MTSFKIAKEVKDKILTSRFEQEVLSPPHLVIRLNANLETGRSFCDSQRGRGGRQTEEMRTAPNRWPGFPILFPPDVSQTGVKGSMKQV